MSLFIFHSPYSAEKNMNSNSLHNFAILRKTLNKISNLSTNMAIMLKKMPLTEAETVEKKTKWFHENLNSVENHIKPRMNCCFIPS